MATKPKIDRFSLDNQLLACIRDRKGAQLDYREACLLLAQDPDNAERKQAVAELEAEIAGYDRTLERLEAAKLAQATGEVQEADADRIQAARDAAQAVADNAPRIKTVLQRLIDAFELTVGPALAELDSLQRERAAHAWAAASGALGRKAAGCSVNTLDRLTGTSASTSALLSAIVRSGLGFVGPTLTPYVVVSAPFSGAGTPDQALQAHDALAEKLDAFLAQAIARAVDPQPATEDQE